VETFNDRLEKLLDKRLDEVIKTSTDTVAAGGLKDHADYRYHAGRIAGMRVAKELLSQALSDIQKQ
jgi:hypothetical protein